MIPMKVYFFTRFLNEFDSWYKSNPDLKAIEDISVEKPSGLIALCEQPSPKDYQTPQIVISARPSLIKLIDKFLIEEKEIVGYKDLKEIRINLR